MLLVGHQRRRPENTASVISYDGSGMCSKHGKIQLNEEQMY